MSLYRYANPQLIASQIKSGKINQDWAVVDVRDSDFIGGHIPGCHHVPSVEFTSRAESLIRLLADVKLVIFHCALSQQRGPSAAKLYAEMREESLTKVEPTVLPIIIGSLVSNLKFGAEARSNDSAQEIFVLRGGFKDWASEYKDDPQLVEGYDSRLW